MNRSRNWHGLISCLSILFFVCLGLTVAVAPAFNQAHAASAVNIGAGEAVADLKAMIEALPDSAFTDIHHRAALLNKIEAVSDEIQEGAYHGAIYKLKSDIKDKIVKWVVASQQAPLLEASAVAIAAIDNASQTTVATRYGKVAGSDGGNNSWVWNGIPYAKPPVGHLRWKAPQNPDRWWDIRQSTQCDVCTQPQMSLLWVPANKVIGSEDCLYAKVYRPKTDAKNLPVYIWIHGGSNYFGGALYYDASILASQANMVVVVIQYRLGPLGWFYYPPLNPGGTPEGTSGNYGTLDTIKAVKWVRENIAAFGGNPHNIMVGGQSAGGFNTQNLLMSPLAHGLFHKAFIESPGGVVVPIAIGSAQANAVIDKLLAADGKTRATMSDAQIAVYLRGKTAETIERAVMDATGSIPRGTISPFIDGTVIPGTFADMVSTGQYSHIPIVMGSTKYELKPFLPVGLWHGAFNFLAGTGTFASIFASPYPPQIAYEYCGYFPARSWKATMVDSLARLMRPQQDDVYTFFFQWGGSSTSSSDVPSELAFLYGAGHAMDIPFFFGWDYDVYGLSLFNATNKPGRVALQQAMMSYLTHFATTGNPNGAGLVPWEQWSNTTGGPKSITFDATNTDAAITMGTWELTHTQVVGEISSLPSTLQPLVNAFVFY
jgi:para-nitrobenzyl esterase